MSAETDRDLADLLPWLVNGTLSGAERSEVEGLVARSDDAALELRLWQAVQDEVQCESAGFGVDMGWRRLERHLQQPAKPGRSATTWRIAAAAAALTIVGFQSLILWRMEDDASLRQLGGPPALVSANEWRVQIRFTEAATVSQINELLLQLDARIVNGPSALGIYDVAVTRGRRFADSTALVSWLREQPIVQEGAVPPSPEGAVPP